MKLRVPGDSELLLMDRRSARPGLDAGSGVAAADETSDAVSFRAVLDAADLAYECGFCVLPVSEVGEKRPDPNVVGRWDRYQKQRPNLLEHRRLFGPPRRGVYVVMGRTSGNAECIDFDDFGVFHEFKIAAAKCGLSELLDRIEAGFCTRTPNGVHLIYRCEEVEGNLKLAQRPNESHEHDMSRKSSRFRTLIETRGEGGGVVEAPSFGPVHESLRPYVQTSGGWRSVVLITRDERRDLLRLCRTFDVPELRPDASIGCVAGAPNGPLRPGADFNARASWSDVLVPAGWTLVCDRGPVGYWRRPGKDHGVSATTNHGGRFDLLKVFTTSTEFDTDATYSKFGAYALLHHSQDFRAAARALAEKGFGAAPMQRRPSLTTDGETPSGPNEADDDPHRLAGVVIAAQFSPGGERGLIYHHEQFHHHVRGAYLPRPRAEMTAVVAQAVKAEFDRLNVERIAARDFDPKKGVPKCHKVGTGLVANVLQAMAGMCLVHGSQPAPGWIGGAPERWPAQEVLATPSQLIHLPSYVDGRTGFAIPATPRFFTCTAIDFEFEPERRGPTRWLEFLHRDLWPDDPECIETLQEWFGYCLTPDTSQQKIALLVGPKRGGKGTICRVLTRLVGANNVCGPTLSSLANDFGLAPLLNRTLAIVSDARISARQDTAVVAERLLAISGEDVICVDRKFMQPVEAKLNTRFLMVSNELPRLSDASGALASRFLPMMLTNSFYGKEDPGLADQLCAELPQILLWALDGWKRLRNRGGFVMPKSGVDAQEEMEELASPISAFLRERCVLDPLACERVDDLYVAWTTWGRKKGCDPSTEQVFGRNIRAAAPSITSSRLRQGLERFRIYRGIRLLRSEHGGEA